MTHDLNLTLKMYKIVFSDKQITEIKKKMHIDLIFTYPDSEIALKVCRNKQRFKFNRRPLWTRVFILMWNSFEKMSQKISGAIRFKRGAQWDEIILVFIHMYLHLKDYCGVELFPPFCTWLFRCLKKQNFKILHWHSIGK